VNPRRRGRPQPDAWSSLHERARVRLAERLDEPLDWLEAAWLAEHLDDCADCRTVDAEYAAQRAELLALRPPVPPRDLWARTSAALDAEAARHPGRVARAADRRSRRNRGWTPFGAIGAVAATFVAAFVVGSQLVGPTSVPQIAIASPPASGAPSGAIPSIATPIPVEQGQVAWCSQENGSCEIHQAQIESVCPPGSTSNCAPLDSNAKSVVKLSVTPKSIVSSPNRSQVIVVGTKPGTASTTIYVVPVSGGTPSPTPTVPPTSATPIAPSNLPSNVPSIPPSSAPSSPAGSAPPPSPSPVPSGAPTATALAILAIASDVVVVGQSAAYSPDGAWFAFSARPVGRLNGPDVYVWHAGDPAAVPVTTDHRSVFAGWVGQRIVGSRADLPSRQGSASPEPESSGTTGHGPKKSPAASEVAGESSTPSASEPAAASASPAGDVATSSFIIDPATHIQTNLTVPAWRPIVDPLGRWAVYWEGTIAADASGERWVMGTGQLMLGSWAALAGAETAAGQQPLVLSPEFSAIDGADWDARWDDTGEHLAVWIGEREDPAVGHLNLVTMDPATGQPDSVGWRLVGRPALVGFSLADGHLAWATPPGQDGHGSQLQVYAWSGPDAGQTHSMPATGTDTVIVVH
jgi:hypothetical protein